MPLSLTRTVGPVEEPVSIPELKAFLRIEESTEDALLGGLIAAARDDVEEYLRRQLCTATWAFSLDTWPVQAIRLPRPPAQTVTGITYVDAAGDVQTFAASAYVVDVVSEPARVWWAGTTGWPDIQTGGFNAITITYRAGWPTVTAIPPLIRHAVMMLAGDLYEHREARLDLGYGLSALDDNPTYHRMLGRYRLLEIG